MAELRDNVSSHAPIDPALVLPPAVAAQRDRANALMALQNGQPAQPQQPQQPPAQPPQQPSGLPPPPQFDPMLAEASQPTNAGPQPFDLTLPGAIPPAPPGAAPPTSQEAPPQGQPPQPPPEPPASAEEWERRFHSINGRFQNELPRMRDTIQQLSERNDRLEQLLASSAPSGSPANGNGRTTQGADAPPLTADFTPQEIEDWGPEFLTMVRRVADSRASQVAQQLRPMVAQTQQNARQQMMQSLDREIPNWREINVSQEFMDWALVTDEFSGAIRRDLLRQWWEANNAPRVAAFFRSFISGMPGAPAAQQPQPTPPAPAPQAPASQRLSLTELAAPSGTGSAAGASPPPAAKRVYKRSEIAQFYLSRSLGHFKGREQEAQAVENDIFLAGREGRVING